MKETDWKGRRRCYLELLHHFTERNPDIKVAWLAAMLVDDLLTISLLFAMLNIQLLLSKHSCHQYEKVNHFICAVNQINNKKKNGNPNKTKFTVNVYNSVARAKTILCQKFWEKKIALSATKKWSFNYMTLVFENRIVLSRILVGKFSLL